MGESFMAALGGRLIANGFPIIPIQPGSKKPGRFMVDSWYEYADWSRHCQRQTTDLEWGMWKKWPDSGIGIACGSVVGIDIDVVHDPKLAIAIEELARKMLGDTPLIRIGLAPKRLLVYRAAAMFAGFKRHPIEVLARGQQFVAHAIHPETGQPYFWPNESPGDVDVSSLPEITDDMARAFVEAAYAMIPAEMKPVTLGSAGPYQGASGELEGTPEAIESALAHIRNEDLPWDDWVRIGMAMKGAIGDAGQGMFEQWSAQSSKNNPTMTTRTWNGFRPTSIGAGSIYHLAFQRGWVPDASIRLGRRETWEPGHHPAQGLIDAFNMIQESPLPPMITGGEQTVNKFVPDAFRNVTGIMKELVDYTVSTANRRQPILALAMAIAAVGVLAGRRYRTKTNLRTNVYVVGMAESGGGKDHARKCMAEAFHRAGLSNHIGGGKIASGSGLLTAVHRQPSILFPMDEFGAFLTNVIDRKKAQTHRAEIWDNFTELFTSAGSIFTGAEYANQKDNPRQDIIQPNAVIHGTTVPGLFWSALQSGSMKDGSIARFLIFNSDDQIPDQIDDPESMNDVPPSLIAGLQAIVAGADEWSPGNLPSGPSVDPKPYTVPQDEAATALLKHLSSTLTIRQRKAIGTGRSAILARFWEHAVKLALIKAVSDDPRCPVITGADVQWAIDIVAYCTSDMMQDAETYVADNPLEAEVKRVLAVINKSANGISLSSLLRATQFLTARRRLEILGDLIASGLVIETKIATKTKPTVMFHSTQAGEEVIQFAS